MLKETYHTAISNIVKLFILIISKRKRGRFWKILEHTIWKTLGSDTSFLPLTRWGRVTYIWVIKLSHHCFRSRLIAWPTPSHYLNQCWNFLNYILGIKFQWNFAQKNTIFIQENAFENVVWKMATILSRPQFVEMLQATLYFVARVLECSMCAIWEACVSQLKVAVGI